MNQAISIAMNKLAGGLSPIKNHSTNITVILASTAAWVSGPDHTLASFAPLGGQWLMYLLAVLALRAQSTKLVGGLQAATIGEMCAERSLTTVEVCAKRYGETRPFDSLTIAEGNALIEYLKTIPVGQ